MKIAKEQRRQFRRSMRRVREGVAEASPPWARRTFGPMVDWLDMVLVDHGVFRYVYPNRHRITDRAFRASQPAPSHIRRYAREGIRTIVNLRGERDCGAYRLEIATCRESGIRMVDFKVMSRAAPLPETIHAAARLFDEIEYPILMHCKSGADRVGLMSVLYLFLKERRPLEEAMGQLDWRYGHFRQADTGILDLFFERYLEASRKEPIAFERWLDEVYDPDELKRSFKARSTSNLIVNWILRRE
ncbi:MAG: sulfur transferase domain-containing protein [Hyphomicrobiaceae bacterium]